MPHFYFHLFDGAAFVNDEEGAEFPDTEAARRYAVSNLRDVAAADVATGQVHKNLRIDMADEHGRLLETIRLREVVKLLAG